MKKWYPSIVFTAIPILIVTFLAAIAPNINSKKNGFFRRMSPIGPQLITEIAAPKECKQLCGATSSSLYFSSYMPGKIIRYDKTNGNFSTMSFVKDSALLQLLTTASQVLVDSLDLQQKNRQIIKLLDLE